MTSVRWHLEKDKEEQLIEEADVETFVSALQVEVLGAKDQCSGVRSVLRERSGSAGCLGSQLHGTHHTWRKKYAVFILFLVRRSLFINQHLAKHKIVGDTHFWRALQGAPRTVALAVDQLHGD